MKIKGRYISRLYCRCISQFYVRCHQPQCLQYCGTPEYFVQGVLYIKQKLLSRGGSLGGYQFVILNREKKKTEEKTMADGVEYNNITTFIMGP